ncbi:glutamate--cysteine ligase [Klebsiella pneumoniae]|uniref:Glutamate--cysteine ligase n=1 Tax=Klebsiella pneumoniae TaxID=573 RepID=A0A2X3D493_KLEPN|nr:glutamate--cysteine ligase [Klebsiella pneumoniae]
MRLPIVTGRSCAKSRWEILSEDDFIAERDASVARQKKVEAEDSEPFEALLARHA